MRQSNTEQLLVHSSPDFTMPNVGATIDMLWQINPNPSIADSSHAVHRLLLYEKNPHSWAVTGGTIYRLEDEGIPNASGAVYPVISEEVIANWHNKPDGVVVVYFPMGRYFSSVQEVSAYELVPNPASTRESRTGAASVPVHMQLAQQAREQCGPLSSAEDTLWDSVGVYIATLPEVSRNAYLADGLPLLLQHLLRPQPTFSDQQLDAMRRGMAYAYDRIAKMAAWKVKLGAIWE